MMMKFNYLDGFLLDLKRLNKKIPSLKGDLLNFEKFFLAVDFEKNKRFVTLTNDLVKGVRIIKTRLMVRSLKGSNKTRLIFSFSLRATQIDFIELYLKNEKDREDSFRIREYLGKLS